MRQRQSVLIWAVLGLLSSLPVFALDYTDWRTDGIHLRGSSIFQQSSNQAFNLTDSLMDAGSGAFALYWVSDRQENGGTAQSGGIPLFGDVPPSVALRDNREQEPDVDWLTWGVRNEKLILGPNPQPPRPTFTPNIPQAWNPVVVDIDTLIGIPDHVLLAVSFEPPTVNGLLDKREQILNAYYPQTALGLPGNANTPQANRATVRPFWARPAAPGGSPDPLRPGLRIRDLAPLAATNIPTNPGVGAVTQAPIFARVPAAYEIGGNLRTEVLPVVYLVVGTGEEGDFARVICLTLQKPNDNPALPPFHQWLPTPGQFTAPAMGANGTLIEPPDPAFFNPKAPDDMSLGGAVMWSYTVRSRLDSSLPTPVAGISFANVGTTNDSRPLLFVTTQDGQVICLNAKAADVRDPGQDGDVAIFPVNDPKERWKFETASKTPSSTMIPELPGFLYGMAPAVARVPLAGMVNGTGDTVNTISNALNKFDVSEWMVFVADTYGTFRAFDAPGKPVLDASNRLTRHDPQLRWTDDPVVPMMPADFRKDPAGQRERFITPPVVYQGNTPLRTSGGAIVNGSSDVGFDDQVIFSSEKGCLYVLDSLGEFEVGGTDDGEPSQTTFTRYKWPTDDTAATPPENGQASTEPRAWPRTLPVLPDPADPATTVPANPDPNNPTLIRRNLGQEILRNGAYYSRSPLAVALGADTNPDAPLPNLDIGDDVVYVPYVQEQPLTFTTIEQPTARMLARPGGAANRWFYEYVGSLKPYNFVQASRPIVALRRATVTVNGNTVDIPLRMLRVGTIKTNGIPSTESANILPPSDQGGANPNFAPGGVLPQDTIYFADTSFYDDGVGDWIQLPVTGNIRLEYDTPTSPVNNTPVSFTERIDYPSCYRRVLRDPDFNTPANAGNPIIVRGRASLSVANTRLEQRFYQRRDNQTPPLPNLLFEEDPALVRTDYFTIRPADPLPPDPNARFNPAEGWRQPAMMAAGSLSLSGTLMAPTFYRGRIIALDHRLRLQRILVAAIDPHRLDSSVDGPDPLYPFGPPLRNRTTGMPDPAGDQFGRWFTYDPGEFYNDTAQLSGGEVPDVGPFRDDEPRVTDVGGSVTLVDGWLYVTYRNGHTRGYSVTGAGAGTTFGAIPYYEPPPPQQGVTNGNLIKAPQDIRFLNNSDPNSGFRDARGLDRSLLLEWGEILYVLVDFGPYNELAPPQSVDPNAAPTPGTPNDEIDGQVLEREVLGQIRSSNGAVQPLPGLARGVRPTRMTINSLTPPDRVAAVVPVFCGIPSPTNPLTPGTPLLAERVATHMNQFMTFQGELTYDIQITQPGLQWRWGPYNGQANAPKQHFWETERNQGATRFPTTAGPGGWTWGGPNKEWAPLVSFNNPIVMHYDPDGPGPARGMVGANQMAVNTVGLLEEYLNRLDPGRKNGDEYRTYQQTGGFGPAVPGTTVDGSRSGNGRPVVPTVGVAVSSGTEPAAKQVLYAEHGKTSAVSATGMPNAGKLFVGDRSHLGLINRPLQLRVQRAPLTKMGAGADFGTRGDAGLRNLAGAPAGSFEQNINTWDDAPDQLYPSIAESRLLVSRLGTSVDLANGPVPVPGRQAGRGTNGFFDTTNQTILEGQLGALGVQVDIPTFTPDDVYCTRWRSSTARGADPRSTQNGGSTFNPFFPFDAGFFGEAGRAFWDRAERLNRPPDVVPQEQAALTARQEDALSPYPDPLSAGGYDDRTRRVVLFNDANNNGILDLLPTFREAYRTFAVQVVVAPDMKMEAQSGQLDFGNLWTGKKQPGTGAAALDIREWQLMNQWAAGTPTQQSVASFYRQYWRPFNLLNTGNVNLAYVKPEVAFQSPNGVGLIGIPSEGNDAWRALSLINALPPSGMGPNPLVDPSQIFLRSSLDDQLLPDGNAAYGAGTRGVWLQKAAVGSGQPGSVVYVDPRAAPSGNARDRDPSPIDPAIHPVVGAPRETWLTLNIPTGTPLGQYGGSIWFYNDRAVRLEIDPNLPVGYRYRRPTNYPVGADRNGTLERLNPLDGLEPATTPPLRIKCKVIENMIHGRYPAAGGQRDPAERRHMPTGVFDPVNKRLMVVYSSNRTGIANGTALQYDLFGTGLTLDSARSLFPFDELPLDRPPWADLPNTAFGWTPLTGVGTTTQSTKPSLVVDPATGGTVLSWTERTTVGPGNNDYKVLYRVLTPMQSPILTMMPGGVTPDTRLARSSARIIPALNPGSPTNWFAFYARGSTARNNLTYSFTNNPAVQTSWSPEHLISTSKSLSTINDPHAIVTAPYGINPKQPAPAPPQPLPYPQMVWSVYSGTSQRLGRTDVYMGRFDTSALLQPAQRGAADPQGRSGDYAQVPFAKMVLDELKANPTRTIYMAGGLDWIVNKDNLVQVYLGRAEIAPGQPGSLTNPVPLLNDFEFAPVAANEEIIFPLRNNLRIPGLMNDRVIVDKSAGIVRLTKDIRTLARFVLPSPAITTQSTDPVLFADYTPATLRLTRGDVSAHNPVIVPVVSGPAGAVHDASWYRQHLAGTYNSGIPVAGVADRLWIFWRRAGGTVSGGPSCYYKVLRPGVRVRLGKFYGITANELASSIPAEEVNPETGHLFFPMAREGQAVSVSYRTANGAAVTEEHRITWQDESGERPVPMEYSVNEGSLDAFATYEVVSMGGTQVRRMERIWLLWSSTRGTGEAQGGDLFYASLAPRIGPEANVNGQEAAYERGTLYVAPAITTRGPLP
jgi:hypothetical protein